MANAAFYRAFHVSTAETEQRLLGELGNGQWDRAPLRQALGAVLSAQQPLEAFEIAHDFPTIGARVMLLNARPVVAQARGAERILLAIEDVTARRLTEATRWREDAAWRSSEVQYRRLFESARDGILILDEASGKIIDVNPYMSELLGFDRSHFLEKELWEIGLFKDIAANRAAIKKLRAEGYLRYDHLPLETNDKQSVEVEVVSNSYEAGGRVVIQCNIRDCSARVQLEKAVRASLQEKEVLLKEVHHRVKNNLQVISSLLHLQSQHAADQRSVRLFQESQDRVRSMALVHERLYHSKDLSQVDFTTYIENLAAHLFSSHQVDSDSIHLTVDAQGVTLPIEAAVPCGLLLNELISNCLKHAYRGRDRGRIQVTLRAVEGSEVLLAVSDDGVGFPPGVEPQAGASFGMQLIADLVEQLHGTIRISRETGTSIRILFPVRRAASTKGTP
jgi:PAS domain S-box-containing protein